jgi:hypothetical protein
MMKNKYELIQKETAFLITSLLLILRLSKTGDIQ